MSKSARTNPPDNDVSSVLTLFGGERLAGQEHDFHVRGNLSGTYPLEKLRVRHATKGFAFLLRGEPFEIPAP